MNKHPDETVYSAVTCKAEEPELEEIVIRRPSISKNENRSPVKISAKIEKKEVKSFVKINKLSTKSKIRKN